MRDVTDEWRNLLEEETESDDQLRETDSEEEGYGEDSSDDSDCVEDNCEEESDVWECLEWDMYN